MSVRVMYDGVYVMTHPDHAAVKIGRSRNPRARALAANLWCPNGGFKVVYSRMEGYESAQIERTAHKLLDENRLQGEWFAVSVDEAVDALLRAEAIVRSRLEN